MLPVDERLNVEMLFEILGGFFLILTSISHLIPMASTASSSSSSASSTSTSAAKPRVDSPIHSLVAGATAGAVEGFVNYPIEFVKTKAQFEAGLGLKVRR